MGGKKEQWVRRLAPTRQGETPPPHLTWLTLSGLLPPPTDCSAQIYSMHFQYPFVSPCLLEELLHGAPGEQMLREPRVECGQRTGGDQGFPDGLTHNGAKCLYAKELAVEGFSPETAAASSSRRTDGVLHGGRKLGAFGPLSFTKDILVSDMLESSGM